MDNSKDTSKMIFVFGSNTAGIHGAGAARTAMDERGAKMGVGWGPTGECYAIPTKGHTRRGRTPMVGKTLDINVIQRYVNDFLKYAKEHPELQFQVTCIGCGLAGLENKTVAPMFIGAPENCFFDEVWKPWLALPDFQYWGTF